MQHLETFTPEREWEPAGIQVPKVWCSWLTPYTSAAAFHDCPLNAHLRTFNGDLLQIGPARSGNRTVENFLLSL